MSSITNGWLALIALTVILTFALLTTVFVLTIINLVRVTGIAKVLKHNGSGGIQPSSKPLASVINGLKSENASLRAELELKRSHLHEALVQAESTRASELAAHLETVTSLELRNLELQQECEDLRSKMAAAGKVAKGGGADLIEAELLIDKASRRLAMTLNERDQAQAQAAELRLEVERLTKEIDSLRLPSTVSTSAVPRESGLQVISRKSPSGSTTPKPPIITRTTKNATTGVGQFDEVDKQWSPEDDTALLAAYLSNRNIAATAESLRVDQRQVALRLVSLLLGPHGVIDDPSASNHGKTYSAADSRAIVQAWRDGRKLPAIARDFQRDQLGIGWRLLDDRSQPVELTDDMIPDIVEGAHR